MNSVNGFTFYKSYFESLVSLPEEDQAKLLRAIVYYVFKDENPELDGILSALWILMKPNLDTSKSRSLNPQNKNKTKQKQKQNKKETKKKQTQNNDLIDKDKDKEKEEDKDKDIEIDKELETEGRYIYTTAEKNFGRTLSPMEFEKINMWLEDYPEEVIEYAIRKSVLANKRNFSYVNGILRSWKTNGYKTLQEIKDNDYSPYEKMSKEVPKELFDFNWLEESYE